VSAAAARLAIDSAFSPTRIIRDATKRKEANMLRIITMARDFFSFFIP
jgi:hypothetical protein